jgi:hypothetical protein
VDNGGAIDFSISMTRRYPTSIRFGGGFRVDCATASRSVRLTFAGCDHRIGRIQPALNDFWAISSARMSERLRQLGIQSGQSRSTALFQLATDLPAAILARMLGSTSASPPPGSAPAAAIGPPTPPKSAAGQAAHRQESDPSTA